MVLFHVPYGEISIIYSHKYLFNAITLVMQSNGRVVNFYLITSAYFR